jgi:natural product precursor
MKKINLKSVLESLSRDEMRTISGGSGYGCNYDSTCSTGCSDYPKGTSVPGGGRRCNYCCLA